MHHILAYLGMTLRTLARSQYVLSATYTCELSLPIQSNPIRAMKSKGSKEKGQEDLDTKRKKDDALISAQACRERRMR